ncbi:MAG: sugar phosphate isomerase/epimerase [Treponema sp.]|nr:sugar phosphate isomerase/epimerase [Treponema sp.]
MKLAFSTLGCHDFTLDQIIASAQKYGYGGLELRHVAGTVRLWELPEFSSPAALEATKKKLDDAGLTVCGIGASGSFASSGLPHRRALMDDLKRWAEVAQGLNCPYLRVFGGPVPQGMSLPAARHSSAEGLSEAVPVMAKYGVTLLLETHDSFSMARDLLPLLRMVQGPVGIVWDILHPIRFGETLEDTWASLAPFIKHVHLKDSRIYNDRGFDYIIPGQGILPLPQMIRTLQRSGYQGWYSFEWERGWHPEIPHSDVAFPAYIEYMKPFAAQQG